MADTLENFLDLVAPQSHLRVERDLGDGFVRLRIDEAERRQAFHDIRSTEDIVIELLRNSRDAHAKNVFLATSTENGKRTIAVIDDGDGIPQALHETIFESRVTSKLDTVHKDRWGIHGRGMALYAVRINADESRITWSVPECGTSILVNTTLSRIGEKSDQSTIPSLHYDGDGQVSMRGPRNILRTCCEFAFEERNDLALFVGSPAEIAATMLSLGMQLTTATERLFPNRSRSLSACQLLALTADAKEFSRSATQFGLSISERTAMRVCKGEIAPLEPLLTYVVQRFSDSMVSQSRSKSKKRSNVFGESVKVHFSREDIDALSVDVKPSFMDLARKYYLNGDVEPTIVKEGDHLVIKFPLRHQ